MYDLVLKIVRGWDFWTKAINKSDNKSKNRITVVKK